MKIELFQIDAFTSRLFRGNPAAVCPLDGWLSDSLMQKIAAENNLSETAFFVTEGDAFGLRWFTPETEVDLCGHATLAAAYVIFNELQAREKEVIFNTRSGALRVVSERNSFILDFPAQPPDVCDLPIALSLGLGGIQPLEVLSSEDYIVVLESETQVRSIIPDFSKLKELPKRGVVVTSTSNEYDFVSRWFGPKVGVNEDPVTGSAHCALAPYWAAKLKRQKLNAAQLSKRGGEIFCEVVGDRVLLKGSGVKYLAGVIELPQEC